MLFNGVVSYKGTKLIYTLHHINGISVGNHELYRDDPDDFHFEVASRSHFAISYNALFLVGHKDRRVVLPNSYRYVFGDEKTLDQWLNAYRVAFKYINGCEPEIINQNELVFDLEDSPDVRIG